MSLVKAVTFDLWETLLFEKDGNSDRRNAARCCSVAKALVKLGVNVSAQQVESATQQIIGRLEEVWNRNEDVEHVEQLELLIKLVSNNSLALRNDWTEELSLAYVAPFFEVHPYLNPHASSSLANLAEEGKRIGLICNTGLTPGFALRRFLESEGVLRFFDYLAFSDEIGFRKPDRRIFHLVARKLETDPSRIVHVGDNLRLDVWGAKSAGFKAILFASEEGKDKTAEADPTSLVARSRRLGALKSIDVVPDKTIKRLDMLGRAIKEVETRT